MDGSNVALEKLPAPTTAPQTASVFLLWFGVETEIVRAAFLFSG